MHLVGRFLLTGKILLLFHKDLIYLVKYHGLHSQRVFKNQGRYLRLFVLNSFNIQLIKLKEACSEKKKF